MRVDQHLAIVLPVPWADIQDTHTAQLSLLDLRPQLFDHGSLSCLTQLFELLRHRRPGFHVIGLRAG